MRSQTSLSCFRFTGFLLLGDRKPGDRTQTIKNIGLRVSWPTSVNYAG